MKKSIILLIGCLLLVLVTFPIVSIFDKQLIVRGIPFLYIYLMVVWALAIVAAGIIIHHKTLKP